MNLTHSKILKDKFKNRELVFGGWLSYLDISIIETFSFADFDFFGIDMEHTTVSQNELKSLIISAQASQKVCLPRPGTISLDFIKPILDCGADGMILPMIESPESAKLANSYIKFPPSGNRSYGVNRAHGFGFNFDEYIHNWNESSIIMHQIESIAGVENLESILTHQKPDAVMIGPYDLSASLGHPGDFDNSDFQRAQEKIIKICNEMKVSCGIQINDVTEELVTEKVNMGFNFVILASDLFILWKWTEKANSLIQAFK
jgi:2-dehydro-3-deoxyglucarate aldolase